MVEKNTITKEKLSNLKKVVAEFICPKDTSVEVRTLENKEVVLRKEGLLLSINTTRDILAFNLIEYIDNPKLITKEMIDGCLEKLDNIEDKVFDDIEPTDYSDETELSLSEDYFKEPKYKITSTIDGKDAKFETNDRVALLKALDVFDME